MVARDVRLLLVLRRRDLVGVGVGEIGSTRLIDAFAKNLACLREVEGRLRQRANERPWWRDAHVL